MQINYSKVYEFPGNYKWNEFLTEGIYIFLTEKREEKRDEKLYNVFTPFYVGQSIEVGPELLRHYYSTSNESLSDIFKKRAGDIFIVYAPIRTEKNRKEVEAKLINVYKNRGFLLCNIQIPDEPINLEINIF